MFICNFKINGKKIAKLILIIIAIIIIAIIGFSVFSVFKAGNNTENSNNQNIIDITASEYTSFLKNAHENIDDYVGMNIKLTGYVYRMPDFKDNQIVIARTMILNSQNSAVVVGMLSEYENANKYKDGDWVQITGTISRGKYKGEMPVIHITEINNCDIPEDEYVYPPTESSTI